MKKNTIFLFLFICLTLITSCNKEYLIITEHPKNGNGNEILSNRNDILSFSIKKGNYNKLFEITGSTITGTTPSHIELKNIEISITISDKATINPNPNSITNIDAPIVFTVTAENGNFKNYTVDIKRELYDGNYINSFNIKTIDQTIQADINNIDNKISKTFPSFINLSNLNTTVTISEGATIMPSPDDIKDYSSPVNFTVTAENGDKKTYTIIFKHLNQSFLNTCDNSNASIWFGGDNRTNVPYISPYDRNVGTGQGLIFQKDTELSSFSIKLTGGFKYDETLEPYNKNTKLKLNIRNSNGVIISSTFTEVAGTFTGGWVDFNLSDIKILFHANTEYIFTWYLINGDKLGINTGSSGYTENGDGFCYGQGYSGQSNISRSNNLENWDTWSKHNWHFNIKVQGKR